MIIYDNNHWWLKGGKYQKIIKSWIEPPWVLLDPQESSWRVVLITMFPPSGQHALPQCILIMSLLLGEAECRGVMAAAAGGAGFAMGAGGQGPSDMRVFGFFIAAFVIFGMMVNGTCFALYKCFRKYVLRVEDPPESFVVDDHVKCRSGGESLLTRSPCPDNHLIPPPPPTTHPH